MGRFRIDRYRIVDDIIYYKRRIYLIPELALRNKIIQAAHDSTIRTLGFLEDLQVDPREVLMEGPQGGGYAARAGM